MRQPSYSRAGWSALCIAVAAGLTGCGGKEGQVPPVERNLKALAVFYGRYLGQNRGVGPPNEADLKKFIRSRPATELETFGVTPDGLDEIFKSPRDNQPFGIAWRAQPGPPGPDGSAAMVAWEANGVGGKRYVVDAVGRIEEIDQATFDRRLAAVPKP